MLLINKFVDSCQDHLTASDPDLERVRKFALKKDLTAEDIWLGRCHAANDRYDRTHERFPLEYLERIAATAPGKAVLGGHDTRSLPLARIYDARVVKDDHGHHVAADYYVNLGTQRGRDLVSDIEAGVLKDVSVTIRPGPRLCDLCGKASVSSKLGVLPGCEHWPGMEYEGKEATATYCPTGAGKVELHELSLVYCGAQYGAEVMPKGLWTPESMLRYLTYYDHNDVAQRLTIHIPDGAAAQGGAMFDTLEKAVAEIERLQKLPLAGDRETELQKAISDLNGRLEPLERNVMAARDWQFAEIRKAAGILGRAQATETLLTHLADSTWETLEKIRSEMATEVAQKLGPVDPQGKADGPGDDEEEKPKQSWRERFRGGYF